MDEVLELVELADRANEKSQQFSGGMKRRLNMAIGLIHEPKVLLLDEPTVGIDPHAREHLLGVVRRLADTGVTVVYTSHYLDEVERYLPALHSPRPDGPTAAAWFGCPGPWAGR